MKDPQGAAPIHRRPIVWSLVLPVSLLGAAMFVWASVFGIYLEDSPPRGIQRSPVTVDAGGIRLVGELFQPDDRLDASPTPGIVLVPGTSPMGRRLPLYEILASELAKRGATVLLFDQRGYGDSPNPPYRPEEGYALEFVNDATAAARLLGSREGVDPDRVRLVGHSFGGSVAIGVAHVEGIEELLEGVLVISPGQGWTQVGVEPYAFRQGRLSSDMHLDPPLSVESVESLYRDLEPETLVYSPPAVPVVLVNGSEEERLKPLRPVYEALSSPNRLVIIKGTGHYFSTRTKFNKRAWPVKIYRRRPIGELADAILAPIP